MELNAYFSAKEKVITNNDVGYRSGIAAEGKMKYVMIILFTSLVMLVPFWGNAQDQSIQALVDQVSGDSIFAQIAVLEKMDRVNYHHNRECKEYLLNYLKKCNFDTCYFKDFADDFPADSGKYLPNIIAVKNGVSAPEKIHIIGAHYDAPWAFTPSGDSIIVSVCPAADDNASGTAGVLEAARVLADYEFKTTMLFILFSGEEIGLHGSEAVARQAKREKWALSAFVNLDMIAYSREGDNINASIKRDEQSTALAALCANAIDTFVPELEYEFAMDDLGDHKSFWDQGYPAITFMDEYDMEDAGFNHFIHTIEDTLGLSANSKILAELITKAAVSTLLRLDEYAVTGYDEPAVAQKAKNFTLLQNYPNPFNPLTNITYSIPTAGLVTVKIYDLLGREIQTLVNEFQQPGVYSVVLYADNMTSGIYFCKLQSGSDFTETQKLVLIK